MYIGTTTLIDSSLAKPAPNMSAQQALTNPEIEAPCSIWADRTMPPYSHGANGHQRHTDRRERHTQPQNRRKPDVVYIFKYIFVKTSELRFSVY
jgi:hypothetical protein